MTKESLVKQAQHWQQKFGSGQRCWSFAHHATLFGSILLSVAAGAVLQFKFPAAPGVATVFTSIAAALTGIATSGGFDKKWRSIRISRSRIDCLLIDLDSDSPDLPALARQLKDIIAQHDLEVVAEEPAPAATAAAAGGKEQG